MRQTLFRISFEQPWAWWITDSNTGLPMVGIAIVAAVVGLIWTAIRWWTDGRKWSADHTRLLLGWGAVVLVLSLPFVTGRLPFATVPVFGYGAMLLVGFLCALLLARRQARLAGIDPDLMYDLGFWLLLPGIAGGRIAYLMQHGDRVFVDDAGRALSGAARLFAAVNLSEGGLVLVGAMAGGAIGFFAFCTRRRIPALQLADVIVPAIFVGIGFGRLGCLLNGCCFGDACTLPWGIAFPHGSVPFNALVQRGFVDPAAAATMPLHPTQIYMSLDGFILALVTTLYFRTRSRPGDVLALGCILCAITRILIEFVRNDEMGQLGTRFTISQFYSLGILAAGIGLAVYLRRQQGGRAATPSAAQPAVGTH